MWRSVAGLPNGDALVVNAASRAFAASAFAGDAGLSEGADMLVLGECPPPAAGTAEVSMHHAREQHNVPSIPWTNGRSPTPRAT